MMMKLNTLKKSQKLMGMMMDTKLDMMLVCVIFKKMIKIKNLIMKIFPKVGKMDMMPVVKKEIN